jgi:diguanylate cyclase (GGDEF)-like protein
MITASGPIVDDHLTVSIGVAVSGLHGTELPELLHAADGALYAAKANGRNQVQLARRGTGEQRPTLTVA